MANWDDLSAWSQAELIEFDRVRSYDESGGDEARKTSKSPPPRRR